jgi:hypothetical protein
MPFQRIDGVRLVGWGGSQFKPSEQPLESGISGMTCRRAFSLCQEGDATFQGLCLREAMNFAVSRESTLGLRS